MRVGRRLRLARTDEHIRSRSLLSMRAKSSPAVLGGMSRRTVSPAERAAASAIAASSEELTTGRPVDRMSTSACTSKASDMRDMTCRNLRITREVQSRMADSHAITVSNREDLKTAVLVDGDLADCLVEHTTRTRRTDEPSAGGKPVDGFPRG